MGLKFQKLPRNAVKFAFQYQFAMIYEIERFAEVKIHCINLPYVVPRFRPLWGVSSDEGEYAIICKLNIVKYAFSMFEILQLQPNSYKESYYLNYVYCKDLL